MSRAYPTWLGVIGWPLEASLSPPMQTAGLRQLGLDWVYLSLPVPPSRLPQAVRGLVSLGATGANVTMPHKQAVVPLLDRLEGAARRLQAVNTIVIAEETATGYNTDVKGFEHAVRELGFSCRGKQALILGAGGAARAVALGLEEMGAGEVMVSARRPSQAEEAASITRARVLPWAQREEAAGRVDLVVNATPIGRDGEDPLPQTRFRSGQLVFDLNYRPLRSPLVAHALAQGARATGGVGMLVHQGALSLELWTGRQAPVEAMRAGALEALG